MKNQRKRYDTSYKARVALEAIKGLKTIQQIAGDFEVHPSQVAEWKKTLLEGIPLAFERGKAGGSGGKDFEQERQQLHSKIGELTIKVDFLAKKSKQLGL